MVSLFRNISSRIRSKVISYANMQKRIAFYLQFVKSNDIVYDIGANRGNRTAVFSKICKRVVAVEPNPELAKRLRKKFGKKISVVAKAVGGTSGEVDLYINKADVLSTTSPEWISTIKETNRFGEYSDTFTKMTKVQMVTINQLIKEHTVPSFVKIDVEGIEFEIIKTIENNAIKGISCEFAIPESRENTLSIITHLNNVGYEYFNVSFGESMEFLTVKHMSYNKMIEVIKSLPDTSWGDIYIFSK